MAKESWLQRLHVKPLIARIQIEFLCGINEFIYCNTLHFFLAKNRKHSGKLTDKVNDALKDMKKDGTLTKISKKWFGEDVSQ
uniref:transporter substrate-binding domain-containing protein n=1 Tax=Weizmannia sp. FSL W8-0676 TaxID=2954703 RepID=UPI00406D20C6